MQYFRKNRPTTIPPNTSPPSNQGNRSASVPQTRYFFVFDEMPEDVPVAGPAQSMEQSYREVLENAVDGILQDVQSAVSARPNATTNESPPSETMGRNERDPSMATPTADPSHESEPLHSHGTVESPPATPSPEPPPSSRKGGKRRRPASGATTPTAQPLDSRRTTQRLRVRRDLQWDDGTPDEQRS